MRVHAWGGVAAGEGLRLLTPSPHLAKACNRPEHSTGALGLLIEPPAVCWPGLACQLRSLLCAALTCPALPACRTRAAGKQAVLERLANRTFTSFEKMEYGRGHRATNYTLWRRAAEPYAIQYTDVGGVLCVECVGGGSA